MTTTSRFLRTAQLFVLILVLSAEWGRVHAQDLDSSHVVIAAIKSVSGKIPDDEFFAIHWRFKFGEDFFTLANMDIALSKDTTSSTSELTEAGLTVAFDLSRSINFLKETRRDLERSLFIGPMLKIFNADAYYGVTMGSLELPNSRLYSSYLQFAYLRPFFPEDNKVPTEAMMDDMMGDPMGDPMDEMMQDSMDIRAKHYLYAEFFIHSEEVPFFDLLAIRGGVLLPLFEKNATFDDIQFRITVAVPIKGVIEF